MVDRLRGVALHVSKPEGALNNGPTVLLPSSQLWRLVLLLVFCMATLAVQAYRTAGPPLDFSAQRQLRSAVLAQSFYWIRAYDASDQGHRIGADGLERTRKLEIPVAARGAILVAVADAVEPVLWTNTNRSDKHAADVRREVGELINHSDRTIILDLEYGDILRYCGGVAGSWWPTSHDIETRRRLGVPFPSTAKLLDEKRQAHCADCFVILIIKGFSNQPDLRALLETQYHKLHDTADCIIYDIRKRIDQDHVTRLPKGDDEE
ncbi:MAG: hypothetical protein JW889_07570 [Verrucomicrobia bacterium]|nr:hypothetical protein [Verrucomicrobiota bacterium]